MRRLAAVAVVLVACTRRTPTPAVTLPAPPSTTAPAAPLGSAVATVHVAPAVPGLHAAVVGVTADGKRALVRLDDVQQSWVDPRFRWIEIATNAVASEWREPALQGLPRETMTDGHGIRSRPPVDDPALEADIVTHAAALLAARARDERFAATPDTSIFNVGDWLYTADTRTGKVGSRLAGDASYYPHVAPSGAFVVYTREQGLLDGVVGNYMPFVAPLPAGAPSRRLEVKDIDGELMELSLDGRVLYVQSGHERPEGGCLVRVNIAPPSAARSLFCVAPDERIDGVRFSPSRAFAVVMARKGNAGPTRAVWLRLPDGKKLRELTLPGVFQVATVDDAGVGLASGAAPSSAESAEIDPVTQRFESVKTGVSLPYAFYGAAWVDSRRFVLGDGGGVRLVDLAASPRSTLAWP